MTQLAAGNVTEADVMHSAILAFAKPHVDTAADVIVRLVADLRGILDNVPRGLPEHGHIQEVIAICERYGALLGYVEPDAHEQAPTLGVARRLAIEAINRAANTLVDAAVIDWGRLAGLPVLEIDRLTNAALATSVGLAHKRATMAEMTPPEVAMEGALQEMQARQAAIRAAQGDHVREIDRLEDIEAVRTYPDTAAWPE